MGKNIVKAGYVFVVFVLLLLTTAAVIKVKSYYHTSTRIGGYDVIGKEIIINQESGEVKKINLDTAKIYTTSENNLWVVSGSVSEVIASEGIRSLEADNVSLVFKCGQWCKK